MDWLLRICGKFGNLHQRKFAKVSQLPNRLTFENLWQIWEFTSTQILKSQPTTKSSILTIQRSDFSQYLSVTAANSMLQKSWKKFSKARSMVIFYSHFSLHDHTAHFWGFLSRLLYQVSSVVTLCRTCSRCICRTCSTRSDHRAHLVWNMFYRHISRQFLQWRPPSQWLSLYTTHAEIPMNHSEGALCDWRAPSLCHSSLWLNDS